VAAGDLGRIADFRLSFARRQAAELTEVPGGVVVRSPALAESHEHNQLVFYRSPGPAEIPALAEKHLGDLPYRRVTLLDDPPWAAGVPAITRSGYLHAAELIMTRARGKPGETGPGTAGGPLAGPVTLAELRPAVAAELRNWLPGVRDAVIDQLADCREARCAGAAEVVFLAARAADGAIASWADLYLDPARDIAQFEDVATAEGHLRRGHADQVLTAALRRATGCSLVFLLADPGFWPCTWYARRGFAPAGQSHVFTHAPAGG
jgi:hypothetical protein